MSRLRVPCDLERSGPCVLQGDAARYLLRARRAAVGDAFVAFDPVRVVEADAVLTAATRTTATLEVGPLRPGSVLPARQATLLQAIGKGDKLDDVVRDATELGATAFVPLMTARSVPRRDESSMMSRLHRVAIEAARQSGRGDVPRIHPPMSLAMAVELPAALRIAMLPDGATPFGVALGRLSGSEGVALVVGPEGGFDDAERETLRGAGFVEATLGPLILRTETVCAAALGALLARPPLG